MFSLKFENNFPLHLFINQPHNKYLKELFVILKTCCILQVLFQGVALQHVYQGMTLKRTGQPGTILIN